MLFSGLVCFFFSQSSSRELPTGEGNCCKFPSEPFNLHQQYSRSIMETLGFVIMERGHIQISAPLATFRRNQQLLQGAKPYLDLFRCIYDFQRTGAKEHLGHISGLQCSTPQKYLNQWRRKSCAELKAWWYCYTDVEKSQGLSTPAQHLLHHMSVLCIKYRSHTCCTNKQMGMFTAKLGIVMEHSIKQFCEDNCK